MKNLLIITALPLEMKIVKELFSNINIQNLKINFLITGVGNLNTIYSLKEYFTSKSRPDFILNIGSCGAKSGDNLDYFQVGRVKYLSNNKEALPPIYLKILPIKEILCSDKIITNNSEMLDFEYVDMESFGIDYICSKEKIPFLMLKKPFDIVSNNSKNLDLVELQNSLKNLDSKFVLESINNFLVKNSPIFSVLELEKFKSKYKLTFSEFEIFKKYLNKKIAFGFTKNDIFKNIKKLEKKEFLQEIKN